MPRYTITPYPTGSDSNSEGEEEGEPEEDDYNDGVLMPDMDGVSSTENVSDGNEDIAKSDDNELIGN